MDDPFGDARLVTVQIWRLFSSPCTRTGHAEVALRDLGRGSGGEGVCQRIDGNLQAGRPQLPDALILPGVEGTLLWGTPTHPRARAKPLQPVADSHRSDVLAHVLTLVGAMNSG